MSSSIQQTVDKITDGNQPNRSKQANAAAWHLVGQIEPSEGTRNIPIHSVPFLVGRRMGVSLCLPSQTVSSVHAEITRHGGFLTVRDLHSTNGTYVNGIQVHNTNELLDNDVVQFSDMAFRVNREVANRDTQKITALAGDQALALIQFDKLIEGQGVVPFFQPIVRLQDMEIVGYEILGRSTLFGLNTPLQMFQAAKQLNLQTKLSRLFRREGIRAGVQLEGLPNLFLNTHPLELASSLFFDTLGELREISPTHPLTLEIHEAAVTDVQSMRNLKKTLRDLDIELAYDDFGAGQTRLVELVEVRPDYLKFDMRMIENIHQAPASRQQMLAALVTMVRDLGITTLAECVEHDAESEVCRQLGFDLAQGFHYGKPASVEHYRGG